MSIILDQAARLGSPSPSCRGLEGFVSVIREDRLARHDRERSVQTPSPERSSMEAYIAPFSQENVLS